MAIDIYILIINHRYLTINHRYILIMNHRYLTIGIMMFKWLYSQDLMPQIKLAGLILSRENWAAHHGYIRTWCFR
jgi:hypothetical protein